MKAKELLINAKLDATYWGKKIIAAEKRGHATDLELRMSRSWTTCACGKQDPRIPRMCSSFAAPEDMELFHLGSRFPDLLLHRCWWSAAETLIAIERRACEIISEVVSNAHNLKV